MRYAEFKFRANERPLRMEATGDAKFVPMREAKPDKITCKAGHELKDLGRHRYMTCRQCKTHTLCSFGCQSTTNGSTSCFQYQIIPPFYLALRSPWHYLLAIFAILLFEQWRETHRRLNKQVLGLALGSRLNRYWVWP